MLGDGANGLILTALAPRALHTNALTQRLPAFAPRTIYRHSRRLTDFGLIERETTEGVPSSVIQRLSERGRSLYRILDSFTRRDEASDATVMNGSGPWAVYTLIGEMWKLGWIQALGERGRSTSELLETSPELSRHQVDNRARQLQAWNLLHKSVGRGQAKRYHLSDRARRGSALILALAHWCERYVPGDAGPALSPSEIAAVLRACLPLLELPTHLEGSLSLGVAGTGVNGDSETATVSAHLHEGKVRCVKGTGAPDSWAAGTVQSWLAAVVDGERGSLRTGGERAPLEACLAELRDLL